MVLFFLPWQNCATCILPEGTIVLISNFTKGSCSIYRMIHRGNVLQNSEKDIGCYIMTMLPLTLSYLCRNLWPGTTCQWSSTLHMLQTVLLWYFLFPIMIKFWRSKSICKRYSRELPNRSSRNVSSNGRLTGFTTLDHKYYLKGIMIE
jgi:hypothetical protein